MALYFFIPSSSVSFPDSCLDLLFLFPLIAFFWIIGILFPRSFLLEKVFSIFNVALF